MVENWTRVAALDEVPSGDALQVKLDDGTLISLVSYESTVYAISDICTHEYTHLSDGWVEGPCIECPLHGAQFDVRTGAVLSLPATQPLKTFEVRVDGQDIYIRS